MSAVTTQGPSSTLADLAYEQLRDRLLVLDIRPGEPLDDDALAQQLGVGRTPVREAFKRLEADRLVIAYPRRGTFATTVDMTDLGQISEVRRALEPLAAAGAARRAGDAARAEMSALARTVAGLRVTSADGSAVVSQRELMRHDIEVHRSIYRHCGNAYLEDVLVRHDNLATRIWCLVLDRLPTFAGHVGEHVALLEAIVAGDEAEAARLAVEHVTGFEETVRRVL
ncbi:GntR family transcriptional regulator [Kineococcus aurantiacus]|uniref:DNA-binding GntR family transcriptional regulator n=1 Tax=Kineococcus aurantiacus TaxID=37633 RepID=A0A7Y9DQH4_9ACTN|nr:GntR family transcriptional regulator [Kineococcus aurantiacus]NYD24838.1 DNA-binding GntR family transcriptional regulator [Kineococcus aurantiacus]